MGSAGRFICDGRDPWYSYESPPYVGPGGCCWKRAAGLGPGPGPGVEGRGAAGVYEVAVFVRKFHRHSSQNGAPPSRGVRHCGQSSASADAFGRPPGAGGGKP
jgi:hypothetical protein